MRLTPPPKVEKLQTALHAKAKQSPNYRFYALYDKIYRADVLAHAYRLCRANKGSPGVDGQTFLDIEEYGVGTWLDELAEELKGRTERKNVPSSGRSAGDDSQTEWQGATVGHSNGPGSRRADGNAVGLGANLRGRLAARAIRLPTG
jgi:hypothetical protein